MVATSLQSAPFPQGIAFDGGNLWVANSGSNNVTELLATIGSMLGTFSVGLSHRHC
jgi:DNA-binding beta-propeller fold protein YncE